MYINFLVPGKLSKTWEEWRRPSVLPVGAGDCATLRGVPLGSRSVDLAVFHLLWLKEWSWRKLSPMQINLSDRDCKWFLPCTKDSTQHSISLSHRMLPSFASVSRLILIFLDIQVCVVLKFFLDLVLTEIKTMCWRMWRTGRARCSERSCRQRAPGTLTQSPWSWGLIVP